MNLADVFEVVVVVVLVAALGAVETGTVVPREALLQCKEKISKLAHILFKKAQKPSHESRFLSLLSLRRNSSKRNERILYGRWEFGKLE